ncbi:MAG TPA: potassium-transporting ATPase subunit KdpA [Candidatus Margulisbacteria bacterium]|nr:MAG: potassium-transporting ATPase subunit KdpA [Candidatus Margulisbacteria bacterium GWE2_39_32]HCT85891.1 potassium-transporting ATPase subunit KdpA [Candidatus Margulisiibacteriota bacterium]
MHTIQIIFDFFQILIFFIVLTIVIKPLGIYCASVYDGKPLFLDPLLRPIERFFYKLSGIYPEKEMDWKEYSKSLFVFNGIGLFFLFLLLMFQHYLPLNPQHAKGFPFWSAVNIAVSYVTNTNWQIFTGETAISYFTQLAGFTLQSFLSAATGISVAISLIRGFARRSSGTIGNFWVDVTRSVLYVLLPISFIAAIVLLSQGVIQNFSPAIQTTMIQAGLPQIIPMGPVASQEAIKLVGTNGGGVFSANSSHPYENPTPMSNIVEIFLILIIPATLTYTFGYMIKDTRQGWAIYSVILVIFLFFTSIFYVSEAAGNPLVTKLGVSGPNMEGKEVRFGLAGTTLFTTATTATSCGAVNAMHDSLTPLGGMVPMVLMLLGEVVFGGAGSGLYTMLAFVVIAVFVAGLMIGRTPEYIGKKVEVFEIRMAVVAVLTSGLVVLIMLIITLSSKAGINSLINPGPHGLSEIIYAFASSANNNGSAFAGLNTNTGYYKIALALSMFIGRYVPVAAIIAMAGSFAKKKYVPPGYGTLPTHGVSFMFWHILVIMIIGVLTFSPTLALGPGVEQLMMTGSQGCPFPGS